jgi:hypothetical protein
VDIDCGMGPAAQPGPAAIIRELRMLPRGRGVLAEDLDRRVGPLLRELCGVAESDDAGTLRRKVGQRLAALAGRLPNDLGHAVRMALALGGSSGDRFLKDRVDQLASTIRRDPRTAKRRVDEGLRRLAEIITSELGSALRGGNRYAPDGWYVNVLRANLLLDRDPPQLIERREIVATTAELDAVVAAISAPPTSDEAARMAVRMDVLQGGMLSHVDHPTSGHYQGVIRLPTTLQPGSSHEYTVMFTASARSSMPPCYALTPLRRCDIFELRVRFDPAELPSSVWALNGVPPSVFAESVGPDSDPTVRHQGLRVDSVGEVQITFTDLYPGLSYGVRWSGQCSGTRPAVALEAYG